MSDHRERAICRELERRLRGLPEDVMRAILDLEEDGRRDVYLTMRKDVIRDLTGQEEHAARRAERNRKRRQTARRKARREGWR